ncbi:MAG: argininosuccinate lyase [Deltaproteobacteria bacterium]|nr:MAG: argininosuccinate lyase [Deltaproteobacteria bacterium]
MSKGARGRRFASGLAPDAADMNASIGFDWRLLDHDVAGSIAHARMLADRGILAAEDASAIERGLRAVQEDLRAGRVALDPALEDIHMNVEARLIDRIGDAGRRLHTARSRNDQVATDLRLYARAAVDRIAAAIGRLCRALLDQAERHVDTIAPGYTHLQRAQPVRWAHHLLAYVEMLGRDADRLADTRRRIDECPLGSGALAATPFPIDREATARSLGFARPTANSLDAAGDRDFAIELVAALALCQVHLSRLGEEIVLWLSQEFRFARLSEAYCSGSSIMPQKVNPDLAELVRAKVGRVAGDWIALITVVKGLPLAYNKDLQETQEPLYDAVDTVEGSLGVMAGMVGALEFDADRLRAAVDDGYLVATELADYLATKGVPFRTAHDVAGALVRRAAARGVRLADLSLDELRAESDQFDADVYDWLDPAAAVDRRDVPGGPARPRVVARIAELRARWRDA